jgi:hypothetical protein
VLPLGSSVYTVVLIPTVCSSLGVVSLSLLGVDGAQNRMDWIDNPDRLFSLLFFNSTKRLPFYCMAITPLVA